MLLSVIAQVHMPSLRAATGWLNAELLGPAELRGHVVVVHFWTLTWAEASRSASTRATRISCCLAKRPRRSPSRCPSTAKLRAHRTAWTSTRTASLLRDGRSYRLVRQHDAVRDRTLEITFLESGAEAYAFTFG
jgi:hypothetical protein